MNKRGGKDCWEWYFKFLEVCFRIINQSETSRLSTTELSTETECLDSFFGSFVERCKTGANFIFGKICLGRVEDVDNLTKSEGLQTGGVYELFAIEKTVCDEFTGAESSTFVSLEWISY